MRHSSLNFSLALVVALFLTAGVTPANASVLTWTVSGATGISGSGTLTTGTEYTPGVFGVSDVTGTFTDTSNGVSGAISYPFAATGGTQTSPDGLYFYDNLFYDVPGQTLFNSSGGLLFLVNGGASFLDGAEVNIAGNGGDGYQLWETTAAATYLPGSGAGYPIDFATTAPEPATMAMLGVPLFGLCLLRRKRTR